MTRRVHPHNERPPAALREQIGRRVRWAAGRGAPLTPAVRTFLERGVGADLTALRIHADDEADRLARALGADAFTAGADVFFRHGAYNPGAAAGLRLLAHEAAHATQQASGSERGSAADVLVSRPGDAGERAADRLAARVVRGERTASPVTARVRPAPEREPLVIQRHASWEHRLLGDAPSADLNSIAQKLPNRTQLLTALRDFLGMWQNNPDSVTQQMINARYPYIRTVTLKTSGLLVTYGELNTLPDYMANPTVLDAQPRAILLPILQAVRQEGYNWINWLLGNITPAQFADAVAINTNWGFLDLLIETKALDSLTANIGPAKTNHYTGLVGRNACHFAPYSWYRWQQFYLIARDLATQAFYAKDSTMKARLTYMAWMNHGYADHFLEDSFAAGHLVNKTLVMQWFLEWVADKWYVPVADWDMVKNLTTARQPGLSARGLYNLASPGSVRDPQTAEEQAALQARMNMCGIRADGGTTQAQAYQNYLAFLNGTVVQSSSGALHDYYNAQSLWVASNAITTPFQIWGDDTMLNGGGGVAIASDTAHMSQQSILDLLASGKSSISTQNILDRFPTSVRGANNQMLPLQQWNDSVRGQALSLFPDLHYYLLRAMPRIDNVSVDMSGGWTWQTLPGLANDIGVGGDGTAWVIGTNAASGGYGIYRWNGTTWTVVAGAAVRVAVGPDGAAWVVNSNGNIYHWNGSSFQQLPGLGKDIGVGADGSVWLIGTNAVPGGYGIYHWNGSGWDSIDGGGVRISVGPDGLPWMVNSAGGIFQRQGTGLGSSWRQLPGLATDIGVGTGSDGIPWITGTDQVSGGHGVYYWDGTNRNIVPGGGVWIATGPDGSPWLVNSTNTIFRWRAAGQTRALAAAATGAHLTARAAAPAAPEDPGRAVPAVALSAGSVSN